jgi:hypothetical protein
MPALDTPLKSRNLESPSGGVASATSREAFVLRCLVYPSGDFYIAECIDLDIAIKRATAQSAAEELKHSISGYIKTVFEGASDRHGIKGLLPRKSPRSHRLRYHGYCALAALSGARRKFMLLDVSPDVPPSCSSYC